MVKLSVNNLNFSYGHNFALRDITFSVDEGQICAIVGPNASGKTTLTKCIIGVLGVSSGAISFDNRDLTKLTEQDLSRILAYVPQIHEASFPYTVMDMVLMGRNPYIGYFSTPKEVDLKKSLSALAMFKLDCIKNNVFTEISGGQQKMVLISRALVQETPLILLDEPTAHLDFRNKLLVLKNIKNLVKEKGVSVLLSLHDPNEVSIVADHTIIMNDGKIISHGETRDVLTPEIIKQIYGIDVELFHFDNRNVFVPTMSSVKADYA